MSVSDCVTGAMIMECRDLLCAEGTYECFDSRGGGLISLGRMLGSLRQREKCKLFANSDGWFILISSLW